MRTIGVVTVGRSDYGLYRPILRAIESHPELQLRLIVSGAHVEPHLGLTVREIEGDGFPIAERLPMIQPGDGPLSIAQSMGAGVSVFAACYERQKLDLLLVLGDRFEMHAAGLAALPFTLPVAHIHGGELTLGAMDDALRHSLTKLSHLHFVSTEEYAKRVQQLGEEPWRITVSGAPGLDNLKSISLLDSDAFAARFGFPLDPAPLMVTYHPVTLEYGDVATQMAELITALEQFPQPLLFSLPNADTGGSVIRQALEAFVRRRGNACLLDNMGTQGYFSAMKAAVAMVGNSSSGIIEAASFELPVVNIGRRQEGRLRARNVIDCGNASSEIATAITQAISPEFRASLRGLVNPYGDGHAAERVVERLATVPLDATLRIKKFHDL